MSLKTNITHILPLTVLLLVVSCTHHYETIKVDYVPSAFPVNFSLFTTQHRQFIAYYDSTHTLTLAARNLDQELWEYKKLDSEVSWDTHNYLTLFVDSQGYIHLSGNMHSSPLNYFKSTQPYDIQTMERVNPMVGNEEDVTTYPKFLVGNNNMPVFHYRYGLSGNGYEIYNYLDVPSQQWKRLLDTPLVDGEGEMNAYMNDPVVGPDGYYHLIWVWRDTPDCSTNHTLSYAKSKDLSYWESILGEKVELPITIRAKSLYVDTTKPGGGLLNGGAKLGFTSNGQPIIFYYKYDPDGNTQLYLAQNKDAIWHSTQLTHWNYRWDFKGMGSIHNELWLDAPFYEKGTGLILGYHHYQWGDKQWVVSENDFSEVAQRNYFGTYPPEVDSLQSDYPGMLVNKIFDKGNNQGKKKYLLRWETLPPNRDEEIKGPKPGPALLELVAYK